MQGLTEEMVLSGHDGTMGFGQRQRESTRFAPTKGVAGCPARGSLGHRAAPVEADHYAKEQCRATNSRKFGVANRHLQPARTLFW